MTITCHNVGIVAVEMRKTLLATSPVEFTLYGCEKYPIVHNPRIYSETKMARATSRQNHRVAMSSAFSQWLTNRNYERIQTHDAPSEDTEKEKNSSRKSNPHGTWKWCYLFHSLLIEIKKSTTSCAATSLKLKCLAFGTTTQSRALKAHAWTWLFNVGHLLERNQYDDILVIVCCTSWSISVHTSMYPCIPALHQSLQFRNK